MKRLCAVLALVFAAGAVSYLGAANDKPQTWKGVVTLLCAAPTSAVGNPALTGDTCRFTLITPSDKKVYVLNPQGRMAKYSKKNVTVTGSVSNASQIKMATNDGVVEASTIEVASITATPGS